MIHVCFGLYDKTGCYSKLTGTAMLSIFENVSTPSLIPSVTVHILHDNTLTQDNRDKFIYVAGRYGQLVEFYNVEELCADRIEHIITMLPQVQNSVFSVGTMYRLLIPQVLPSDIEKAIYLDSDMLINLNINKLWQAELDNKPLAAVPESQASFFAYREGVAPTNYLLKENFVQYEDYFNAGLLVMNLKYLREAEKLILSGIKFLGDHPHCKDFDQGILNYLFSKIYLKLPVQFDRFIYDERRAGITQIEHAIYHYSHPHLQLNMDDIFNRLWFKYFVKTPWFNEDTIGRLYENYRQMHTRLKNAMADVSAIMSGKTRAFFTSPQFVDLVKKVFSIHEEEEIILAENQESLQKLIDAMKHSQGKKVFFIVVNNFPFNILAQVGFVYGKDFMNGIEFFSEENGVFLDSYEIIKAM